MTDARDIIARDLRKTYAIFGFAAGERADLLIQSLTSAGFRILGPDEIDGPTVEKCAEVLKILFRDADTDKALAHFPRRVSIKEKRT